MRSLGFLFFSYFNDNTITTQSNMTDQTYIVAGGNAYIIDSINGTPYGAPVNTDGTIDWDCTYDFDPRMDEDLMIQTNQILHTLKQLAQLTVV